MFRVRIDRNQGFTSIIDREDTLSLRSSTPKIKSSNTLTLEQNTPAVDSSDTLES